MSVTTWNAYFGTNPIVRIGGSGTLRLHDSEVQPQAGGRISGAGWPYAMPNFFGKNVSHDITLGHFISGVDKDTVDTIIHNQRNDLFGRIQPQPHDLYISKSGTDLIYAALEKTAPDTEGSSAMIVDDDAGGNQSSESVVLGDLNMWTQDRVKTGSWSIFNANNTGAFQHKINGTDTNADWVAETQFQFMGWINSTGTATNQNLFRKVGVMILAFSSGQLNFSYAGTNGTFSPVFPMGNNRWLFIAIRKPVGTTAELYYAFDWETTLNGPFTCTVANSPPSNTNDITIGSAGGGSAFQGYMGAMVFANRVLSAANIESEFDRTKVGGVPFTDTSDPVSGWTAVYGVTPTKVLFFTMERITSHTNGASVTNLMLTKVYNVFYGMTTPANGAINLDHITQIAGLSSLNSGDFNLGTGDRLFLGKLGDFTSSQGYSNNSEIVYLTAKNVAPADVWQTQRVTIAPVNLPRKKVGFRASHFNGQSFVVKFARRHPWTSCEGIGVDSVETTGRGRMREVRYQFASARSPFLSISGVNYDNLDKYFSNYPP